MTDQVLNILKFVLLGLLYLFFARVLWAVWSEVRAPVRRQQVAASPSHPSPGHTRSRGRAGRGDHDDGETQRHRFHLEASEQGRPRRRKVPAVAPHGWSCWNPRHAAG